MSMGLKIAGAFFALLAIIVFIYFLSIEETVLGYLSVTVLAGFGFVLFIIAELQEKQTKQGSLGN